MCTASCPISHVYHFALEDCSGTLTLGVSVHVRVALNNVLDTSIPYTSYVIECNKLPDEWGIIKL